MKIAAAVAIAVLCAACGGEMGPPGEPGPPGPMGATGVSIAVTAWVDAANAFVSTHPTPLFIDAEGFRWVVDTDSGDAALASAPNTGVGPTQTTQFVFYETPDCMGQGYILGNVGTGVAFVTCADAAGVIRVRGAADSSFGRRLYSQLAPDGAGGCRCVVRSAVYEGRAFPIPSTRATPTTPTFTGPLRMAVIK